MAALLHSSSKLKRKRRPPPEDGEHRLCAICGETAIGFAIDQILF